MKNEFVKNSLGVDISSDKWDFNMSVIDQEQRVKTRSTKKFKITEIASVEEWIEKKREKDIPLTITMEATGVYYEELAWRLHLNGYRVSVILPNKGKRYLESLGLKSKNDKIDAMGLAQMGAERSLAEWKPVSEEIYSLRLLTRHHESIQEERGRLLSQSHARSVSRVKSPLVDRQLKSAMEFTEKQLSELKKAIDESIQKDTVLKEKIKNITKVKGIANLTVATVIAETNGFADIKNLKQLTSYAGYDVVENSSGKHVGKTRISKRGNSRIRRILYFAAINTVRYQQGEFKALYDRVYKRTGLKMKALVAVQRKVLGLIYSLYKNDEAYDPQHYKKETSEDLENKPSFRPDGEAIIKEAGRHYCLPALGNISPTNRMKLPFVQEQKYEKNIV